ncbi:hypothetical protein OAT67_02560 [Bacteriovoracaceae bacterium]|nr:hypothetical protein [Bacteriovoracaceae bacterium]|tara:strand:- start:38890 stop:39120 length:231 start_codon:yes stop_codon:yes gene_type:complete
MQDNNEGKLNQLSFDEAINILKKIVKNSHIKGQKHLDLSVATAEERPEYEKALMVVKAHVAQGHVTNDQLNEKLGL